MSSYFSVINDNGVTTIDDNTQTLGVVREGSIRANISRGEIYGFSIAKGESVSFRPERDTKMICSPPLIYGGNFMYFVATTSDVNIKYRVYKKVSFEAHPSHGCGMLLFDDQERTMFNSSLRAWRHKGYYQSNYFFKQGELSEEIVKFLLGLDYVYSGRISPQDYNDGGTGNEPTTIALTIDAYVNPLSSPWITLFSNTRRIADHRFTALGYIFSGNKLTTERYFNTWYIPRTVFGSGNIDCLSVATVKGVMVGIMSGTYMFNIVE